MNGSIESCAGGNNKQSGGRTGPAFDDDPHARQSRAIPPRPGDLPPAEPEQRSPVHTEGPEKRDHEKSGYAGNNCVVKPRNAVAANRATFGPLARRIALPNNESTARRIKTGFPKVINGKPSKALGRKCIDQRNDRELRHKNQYRQPK
ncbi:MAG: hypothetical protein QM754_01630 [Tepidisphaeraceae bacterium]